MVINLQGDLPLIEPSSLTAVLKPLEDPTFDIGTLAAPVTSDAEHDASQVVKIACAFDGADVARALYFSRLPIPWGEAALASCRDLCLASRGAGAFRDAAALRAGAPGKSGTAAGA